MEFLEEFLVTLLKEIPHATFRGILGKTPTVIPCGSLGEIVGAILGKILVEPIDESAVEFLEGSENCSQ